MIELGLVGFIVGLVVGAILMRLMFDERPSRVLFFPDKKRPCERFFDSLRDKRRVYCSRGKSCWFAHGLPYDEDTTFIEIVRELDKAKKKIDICMFLFTYEPLMRFLIFLRTSRAIQIRVITDSKCETDDKRAKDQSENLSKSGIEIKSNATGTSALMHNKFVIVDDKQLIFGSSNWTKNAILHNYESVMIIHTPNVVKSFKIKFDRLWSTLGRKNFAPTSSGVAVDFY